MLLRPIAAGEWPEIPLDGATIVIGRDATCNARLNSIEVSRRHCSLTPLAGELEVKDLGSTNGIRINGRPVGWGRVRPGDELTIGSIRYQLEAGAEPEKNLGDVTCSEPWRRIEVGERERASRPRR